MLARLRDNGPVSEAFVVINGVKQDCVLAPTLCSLMFSAMLMDAYRDEHPGISITYRTDGQLNRQRMHFQSRVSKTTVHENVFANDCVLNITSEGDMQGSMKLLNRCLRLAPNQPAVSSSSSTSSSTPTTKIDRAPQPPLPSSSSSSSSSSIASTFATAAPLPTTTSHNPDTPTKINPTPTIPSIWDRSIPVLIATAPSPHTPAWSVTYKSIIQRLANQCLAHQPTLAAFASTVHTTPTHSPSVWVHSGSCVSTRAESTAV
nr:unnamed protein product [Spirometra erinaceieuropaei]